MAVSPLEIPGEILVRGAYIPNSADLSKNVNQWMHSLKDILSVLNINKLNDLQERIIFSLQSDVDLFITGPRGTGKTTGYVIPILECVYNELFASKLAQQERRSTPCSIIFCESTKRGIKLKRWFNDIFNKFSLPSTSSSPPSYPKVCFIDNINNETMLASLKEPIDILILTASALQELITSGSVHLLASKGLKYNRARYVIFEEFGMRNYFSDKDVIHFLNEISDMTSRQTILDSMPPDVQFVFSGSVWYNEYIGQVRKNLCSLGRKSVMIFGSSLQALQYSSSVTWKMDHLTSEKAKLNSLIGICKGALVEKRNVVVACSSSELAQKVSKYISEHGDICNNCITYRKKDMLGIFKKNRDWLGNVYVVSDDAWEEFEVYTASYLIHFDIDMPSSVDYDRFWNSYETYQPFCLRRFSCLWMRMEREWKSNVEPPGTTHLLLSGKEPNFLELYKFLQTMNIVLPQSLEDIAEQRLKNELLKKPLCTNFRCFAYCNAVDCLDRHEVSQEDLDIEPIAPRNGELEFKVIESISPSLYLVKLLNHFVTDENTNEKICAKSYLEESNQRIMEMTDYYSCEKNRIHPITVKCGDLLCIPLGALVSPLENGHHQISSERIVYLRAKIIGFLYGKDVKTAENSRSSTKAIENLGQVTYVQADYAKMFCVDHGRTKYVSLKDLIVLAKQFRQWKPHCIQLVLSNLMYLEETKEYYSDALQAAKRLTEGQNWHGKVRLSIKDTVWVTSMVKYKKESLTDQLTVECNLVTELISGKYAILQKNHKHMMMMMEYIRNRDPNYSEIYHEMNSDCLNTQCRENFHEKGDHTSWMELPLSNLESHIELDILPQSFKIQSWINPWEIYGTILEKTEKILQLEDEISRDIERLTAKQRNKSFKKCTALLEVGSVVAVKGKSRWQRGMVVQKYQKDKEVCNRLNVFLVDYGIMLFNLRELEEVVPIRKVYVESLPFQVVCVQLSHIKPVGGEGWKEIEVQQFSSRFNFNNLNVIAFKRVEGTCRPCNYYEAMMYNKLEERAEEGFETFHEIGVELMKRGYAESTPRLEYVELVLKESKMASQLACYPYESCHNSDDGGGECKYEVDPDEEDGESENSVEMWKRFSDVDVKNDEFVAIADEESSRSFDNVDMVSSAPMMSKNQEGKENMRKLLNAVCRQLNCLEVISEEETLMTADNGSSEDEEFQDAIDLYEEETENPQYYE